MYELTRKFIEQELADPDIPWTDRQREMLQGMSDYLGDVQGDLEAAIDKSMNPGKPPEWQPPVLEPDEEP
jgi:hypothetical protein